MKKRYTEAQIAFALRQAASGTPVGEITRKMGVTDVTFYRWKKIYANLGVAEIRRLKQIEDDNRAARRRSGEGSLGRTLHKEILHMKSILFVLVTVYASAHAFGQIQVGVWTDKPSYQYGDTIAITITAYNPAADTVVLHFGSVCQASYIFDNFNLFDILMCPAILTSRSIPPSGTASWNDLKYPLYGGPLPSIGAHVVLGQVIGCAMSDTLLIFVTPTTLVTGKSLTENSFLLAQNYPNPFNGATTIPFTLSSAGRVVITLYNSLGQRIRTLLDDYRSAGSYTVRTDLNDFPSGIYWCRLQMGGRSQTTKLIMAK